MDLANIFFVTSSLALLSISGVRAATVTLSKSAEKGQLGNNSISLFCDYILSTGERVFTIDLKRKRTAESGFYSVVSYYEDNLANASYYTNGLDLVGRTVLTNPSPGNRKAILQFNSVQCADEADYRCELLYAASGQGNSVIYSDIKVMVTTTPTFGNQSLLYTPSTNIAENQIVTFTCIGNVGREPQGTFSWYKYIGQSPGMVITNGINPISLVNVAGSCTSVRTESLTLNLTKDDNQIVIRCTVQQTIMTEAGDGNIQTYPISVSYAPRIMHIKSDPDLPMYSEGMPLLMLICNADSNPSSSYVWTLPDGSAQTGYQLRLTTLTTNHTGQYMCLAFTGWGGVNYTANKSINITVVITTSPPPATTTSTQSSSSVSVSKQPGTSTSINIPAHTVSSEKECISSALFAVLFGVVLGVSVVLVTILSICFHKQRILASDLKEKLQNRTHTYDGLNMRVAISEPYAALNVEPSEDYHQSSAYLNLYEGLHRTLESSEPYDILEKRI